MKTQGGDSMDVGDIFRGGNASFLGGLIRKSQIDRRKSSEDC